MRQMTLLVEGNKWKVREMRLLTEEEIMLSADAMTTTMPKLGEIKKGREIGKKSIYGIYVWHACEICGKERWVRTRKGQPIDIHCLSCAWEISKHVRGSKTPGWKGGRVCVRGYIKIWVSPEDFFYSMATGNSYILEHRLVMAKHLGRCLHSWEIVHHKNHIRDDNRIENLQLVTDDRHKQLTILETKVKQLQEENKQLKEELKGKWNNVVN